MSNNYFAVIDVETNWSQKMMSVGMVIADSEQFVAVDKLYFIISPEYQEGGYFSNALRNISDKLTIVCSRAEAISRLQNVLSTYGVESICAYNAKFDYRFLPELHNYTWRDIMCVAANLHTNDKLPKNEDYFSTGLLRRKSFERIMRLVYWQGYTEGHNALGDAVDELQLMQIINQKLEVYTEYKPSSVTMSKTSAARKHQKDLLRNERNLNLHKHLVEELCSDTIRLICVDERKHIETVGGATSIHYIYLLNLECSHCGYHWVQNRDSFFENHACPKCKKTTE